MECAELGNQHLTVNRHRLPIRPQREKMSVKTCTGREAWGGGKGLQVFGPQHCDPDNATAQGKDLKGKLQLSSDVGWLDLKRRTWTVQDGMFGGLCFWGVGQCYKHELGDVDVRETGEGKSRMKLKIPFI